MAWIFPLKKALVLKHNEMPKLFQINVTANWGSTGKIVEECNLKVIPEGWEVYSAYGRYMNPSKSILIRVGNKYSTYEHYIENRVLDNEGLASRFATKALVKKIKKIQPDIIHLHNIHDHWLNYEILFNYLNQTEIKVVWTFHDFWAITGHCSHFVSIDCKKWQTECRKCQLSKSMIDRSKRNFNLKRRLFLANKNLHIVSVSQWVGENIKRSFLGDKDCRVIENGVDASVFKPTMPSELAADTNIHEFIRKVAGKFVIMAVSSQWKSSAKGLDDYIVMSKMLRYDEVIVLVGVNNETIAKLPHNIIGVKRTNNQQELAALYTRADVVTSFSSAETFGLTIVEGYDCGTPAVVYDNTAPPLLITPATGFVVPNKDYKAAYAAIQSVKSNGKLFYTDACVQLGREKFSKEQCFEKYMLLYKELLSDRK